MQTRNTDPSNQALVVLGHPRRDSLNAALAQAAADALSGLGWQVTYHDLCAQGFDPAMPGDEEPRDADLPQVIEQHCADLSAARLLVVVHPNWWGMPPAVLKGWVDRVFRPGVAYEFLEGDDGEGVPVPLLTNLELFVVINTTNTEAGREAAIFGDPLQRIWEDCICGLCSNARFTRKIFGLVCTSTPDMRAQWLAEARELMAELTRSEAV